MARVICTLPNASHLISGVKFEDHELGVVSEEISDDVAAEFAATPGYQMAQDSVASKPKKQATPPPADPDPVQPGPAPGQASLLQ